MLRFWKIIMDPTVFNSILLHKKQILIIFLLIVCFKQLGIPTEPFGGPVLAHRPHFRQPCTRVSAKPKNLPNHHFFLLLSHEQQKKTINTTWTLDHFFKSLLVNKTCLLMIAFCFTCTQWQHLYVKSYLTLGPHERSTDIADLLTPESVLTVTLYLDIRVVLDKKKNKKNRTDSISMSRGFFTQCTISNSHEFGRW